MLLKSAIIVSMSNPALQKKLQETFDFDVKSPAGELKNMSTILNELFMKYQDLGSLDQGELLQKIGGKQQASRLQAMLDGYVQSQVLAIKEKEFVALGMSIILRCEPCINFHVEALMKAGATREELGDVLAMAIQMGGGPGLMYAGHALACWDELAAV